MGKRELFIALAFIAAGAVAYQLTAPPASPAAGGFSLTRFWTNARRGMRGNAAQATFSRTGSLPVSREQTDVRLEGPFAQVQFIGEARADIAYELNVQSSGPDRDAALASAKQVTMKADDMGASLIAPDQLSAGRPSVGRR